MGYVAGRQAVKVSLMSNAFSISSHVPLFSVSKPMSLLQSWNNVWFNLPTWEVGRLLMLHVNVTQYSPQNQKVLFRKVLYGEVRVVPQEGFCLHLFKPFPFVVSKRGALFFRWAFSGLPKGHASPTD